MTTASSLRDEVFRGLWLGVLASNVGTALSFAIFAAALLRWRRPPEPGTAHPERFGPALRAGGRYVRYSPLVRRVLVRTALFVVPGSVVWSLLPLVAERELGLGSGGYGLALIVVVAAPYPSAVVPAKVLAGLAWMLQISRRNAGLQLFLLPTDSPD